MWKPENRRLLLSGWGARGGDGIFVGALAAGLLPGVLEAPEDFYVLERGKACWSCPEGARWRFETATCYQGVVCRRHMWGTVGPMTTRDWG